MDELTECSIWQLSTVLSERRDMDNSEWNHWPICNTRNPTKEFALSTRSSYSNQIRNEEWYTRMGPAQTMWPRAAAADLLPEHFGSGLKLNSARIQYNKIIHHLLKKTSVVSLKLCAARRCSNMTHDVSSSRYRLRRVTDVCSYWRSCISTVSRKERWRFHNICEFH